MAEKLPDYCHFSSEVARARALSHPIVALESTVITHGLPRPQNLSLAEDMEQEVRSGGAVPATIAILDGYIHLGLTHAQLSRLANETDVLKVSRRDFATAITSSAVGGTTVAGTMLAANAAGIKVFATGGIGGVHKEARFDVSADLQALADTPMIVVCAGAKSILDLPATLEYLETMSVPVVGFGTEEFPAFYVRSSGFATSTYADTAEEVVEFAWTHWDMGLRSAVLVCQPIPKNDAMDSAEIDWAIEQASREVVEKGIHGQDVTPFELRRVTELTGGRSMRANISLLKNNANLAAKIARAWSAYNRPQRTI